MEQIVSDFSSTCLLSQATQHVEVDRSVQSGRDAFMGLFLPT